MKQKIINSLKLILVLILFFNIGSILTSILGFFNIPKELLDYQDISYLDALSEVILMIVVVLLYKKTIQKDYEKLRNKFDLSDFLKYLGIFLVIKIASAMVTGLISFMIGMNLLESENQSIIDFLVNSAPIMMLVSTSFLAPVVEEGIFRLGFRKVISNDKIFIIISGLIFGLMHIFPTSLLLSEALTYAIVYVAIGVCLAWTYVKTDNIWYVILIHALNNLLGMLVLI